jgi:hypothetical protein
MINFIKVIQPDNVIDYRIQNNNYFICASYDYPFNYCCYRYKHQDTIFQHKSKEFAVNYLLNLKFSKFEYFNGKYKNLVIIFDISIYTNHWKKFVKKKRKQRLTLKLLKGVSEHLGNPRFIDFKI